MKIVILSGSPHKNGTTARLADSFIAGAKEAGHEVERFDVAFMNVHPCIACETCHASEDAKCAFQDDMNQIVAALAESDAVAVISPIYYYGLNAQVLSVINRFYAVEPVIRRNQKAVLITAMSDDKPDMVEGANKNYMSFCKWLEWNNVGILNAFEAAVPSDLDGTEYEAKAFELGKRILNV